MQQNQSDDQPQGAQEYPCQGDDRVHVTGQRKHHQPHGKAHQQREPDWVSTDKRPHLLTKPQVGQYAPFGVERAVEEQGECAVSDQKAKFGDHAARLNGVQVDSKPGYKRRRHSDPDQTVEFDP